VARAYWSAFARERDIELIFFDPPEHFDHAILGLVEGFGQELAVLYDMALVLEAMAKDMGEEEAEEWISFNTIGAYVGPATPRFLMRRPE
jgi:hypothetical protein